MINIVRVAVLCSMLAAVPAQAQLVFSAPPDNGGAGKSAYEGLVRQLTKLTGESVVYSAPANWVEYSTNMRAGKYDIVLDNPHFASWRIKRLEHRPLARVPGTVRFFVVTEPEDSHTDLQHVSHHRFCTSPSPNLAAVSLLSEFTITVPELVEAPDEGIGAVQTYESGRCEVILLRDSFYDKQLSPAHREKLAVVHRSPAYPNPVLTVGPKVEADKAEAIRAFLVKGDPSLAPVVQYLGGEGEAMSTVGNAELKEFSNLLEGVVWGW